ncbi:glycosyltransferase family 4 protein [Massilia cellulosiltytica]|uniref:glycosyltransferase family 4 protein n=1 Tax=Massilia TaxID=149698 RepID=UPI0009EB99C2|nr:glycosyltransferase family 4 protein [Massilia sp. Root1485]
MIKVGFFSDQVIYGGGESNLVRLAKSLSSLCAVTIVAPPGALLDAAAANGIDTLTMQGVRSRWLKGLPIAWGGDKRILDNFDIVHAYSLHVLPFLLGHPRLFWTVHGPWEKPWGLRAKVIARYVKKAIAVSRDVARSCSFPSEKLAVVPLGAVRNADCLTFPDETKTLHDVETLNIGVLGRIQRVKGQDIAIDAVLGLAKQNPTRSFRLHFGGSVDLSSQQDKEYQRELEKRASICVAVPNISIVWHGFIKEPTAFIDSMDLILVPSRYESFSMVLVEALSRGKLAIAPEIGGPAEIISTLSVGQKFEAGSANSLMQSLQYSISDLRYNPSRIVERARDFTIESQSAAIWKIYGQVSAGDV